MPCANLVASALLGPEASTTRFVPLVGDGQSVATGKFRPRSPDEQSKRGAGNQRQDTVPFLSYPEEQKLRFQGEKPLRSAARLLPPGSRKVAGPVSAPPVPPRCAGVGRPVVLVCASASADGAAPQHTQQDGRPQQQRQRACGELPKEPKHRESLSRLVAAGKNQARQCSK